MEPLLFYLRQIKRTKAPLSELIYFFKWKNSLSPNSSSVKDEQPWITFSVINFLKKNVKSGAKVFEYGGGGSTLFFINKGATTITVEHNKEWFDILKEILLEKKTTLWRGNFIEAQEGDYTSNPDPANPLHYATLDENYKSKHFYNYATEIDKFGTNYFDFVLVDGRSRPSCLKHSISRIKKGGYLILDNSDRDYYLTHLKSTLDTEFEIIIDSFGASPYSKSFTKTTVWKKK